MGRECIPQRVMPSRARCKAERKMISRRVAAIRKGSNLPFFYNENVVERAATILHEARHADWCGHNGNDGSNKCPAASDSCDEEYLDGCSGIGSPSGRGADGYQVLWLWWYAFEADAIHSSSTMKAWARDEANRILNTMLDVNPCFNI